MAITLHSLDILNNNSFSILSNFQELSNIHLTSLLVEQLSPDIINEKKYIAFLKFLKSESSLMDVYYKMIFLSKFFKFCVKIVII